MSVNKYDATTDTLTKVAGNATVPIDDTTPSTDKIYSSSKVESLITNPNLFDNAWFTVNQRGYTTSLGLDSTGRYFVDRWIIYSTDNKYHATYNYFYSLGAKRPYIFLPENLCLMQHVDINKIEEGKTYTISVKFLDGTIESTSFIYKKEGTSAYFFEDKMRFGTGLWANSVRFLIQSISTLQIQAVKLEVGSVSTLANDVMPDYQAELLRCQMSTADSYTNTYDTYANKKIPVDAPLYIGKNYFDGSVESKKVITWDFSSYGHGVYMLTNNDWTTPSVLYVVYDSWGLKYNTVCNGTLLANFCTFSVTGDKYLTFTYTQDGGGSDWKLSRIVSYT